MKQKKQVVSTVPLFTVFMLPLFLSACGPSAEDLANGNDPLAALSATAMSTRYTEDHWVREHQHDPDRFQEAVAFCAGKEYADFPNCRAVIRAKGVIDAAATERLKGRTYTGTETPFAPDSTEQP